MTPSRSAGSTVLRLLAAISVLTSFTAPGVAQSAWTRDEGRAFLQVSLTHIGPYDKLFTEGGSSFRTGREITETSLEFYGEYGLADGWTLVGNVPLRSVDSGSTVSNASILPVTIPSDTLIALGNVLFGLRRQFATGTYAFAGQLDLELPTSSGDSGLRTGLDAWTLRPWLSVGRGFGAAYAQMHFGFSLRNNDYSNDWRFGTEVGYRFTEELLLAGTLDLVESSENGGVTPSQSQAQTGLWLDEQEYASIGVKGLYRLTERLGISGAIRGAFSGNNVPESPFLSLGLTYEF